ncbi:hypothetical protein GCM10010387_12270 [Streptomyces inusitatus]|uniref:TIGR04222 domain-containing membrane protein n=1 Tax=Streptomyces inusitatus TaxID=68221 RepID=A0A918PSU1_9ACTN|nr:hypothetical protein [Streptomyces inusitatus]GGZ20839.1 hypothetical protein GCM10010387_12270 [Streptomyces inusitatus]
MGWMTGEARFALWWLLGFAAVNAALGCWCLIRGWTDRATIRRVKREGIGPVEASWQAGGERTAARTAVGLLALRGAVDISDAGVITAVPGAPEPSDPVLSALFEGIRRRSATKRTRLYEILDADTDDFAPYRSRLADRVPAVRHHAEPGRAVVALAACVIGFGISAHGLAAGVRLPSPFLGGDPALWVLVWWPLWGLLALAAAAWPDEGARRWRRFNRYCRRVADAALEGLPDRTRRALSKGVSRRAPRPRRELRPSRSKRDAPNHGGGNGWSDDTGTHSCGGGCGGGD